MNSPNHVKLLTHGKLPVLTSDHVDRRSLLKGVSLGAGAVVLGPFLRSLEAHLGLTHDGHAIGHQPENPVFNKMRIAVNKYHVERVASLAAKLAALPEGNGTMLDNSLLVYLSDAAETHHGRGMQWPVVLVGNMGGRLKAGGRLLGYPGFGKTGHRTTANLFLSLLHAVGDRREKFGIPRDALNDLDLSGPLAEILT